MSSDDSVHSESEYESESESESDYADIQCFKYQDYELKPVKSMAEFHRRFELGTVLGSGGDGDVYTDKTKTWPAIKQIDLNCFEDPEHEIKRAQQEQRLLAKAKIANIYGIYHNDIDNELYKIYDRFDYALDDIVDKMEDGMTETQTKHIIYNICCDVKKLHSQQFIHCDIKPSNILYTKRGTFKMKNTDKQTFKLIDYDGAIWNQTNDVVCTSWQGSLPFSAPEMNDYTGDINNVGYGVDIWSIGLLIIYCINGGDLGSMDIADEDHAQFYSEYSDEEEEEEVKGGIFDEWYQDLFAEQMGYKQEMDTLYRNKKISADLYDLLHDGILVKNPEERMDIDELMTHTWFESVHEVYTKNIIIVNDEHKKQEIDVYEGIMNDDTKIRNQTIMMITHFFEHKYSESDTEEDEDQDEHEETEETPEIRYYSDEEHMHLQRPQMDVFYGSSSLSFYSSGDTEGVKSPKESNTVAIKGSMTSDI